MTDTLPARDPGRAGLVGHRGRLRQRAGRPDGGVPRWPASEDVDPEDRTGQRDDDRHAGPDHGVRGAAGQHPDVSGRTPGRRRRRPRGPLPAAAPAAAAGDRPVGRFAWAGALGGPACSWCWPRCSACTLEGWVGLLALGGFMAGFVTLVARMKDRPPNDPARTTEPSSESTREDHRVSSETVEVRGHLIDSGVLSRVLDDILEYGGDYSIDKFEVGKTPVDESYARLTVKMEDDDDIARLVMRLQTHGVNPTDPGEAHAARGRAGRRLPGRLLLHDQPGDGGAPRRALGAGREPRDGLRHRRGRRPGPHHRGERRARPATSWSAAPAA